VDFTLNDNPERSMFNAACRMNDYRKTRSGTASGFLTPKEVATRNWKSRAALDTMLSERPKGVTADVVVTHHAPHENSIHMDYVDSDLRPSYATDLTAVMQEHSPRYWLHGHIHVPAGYTVGATQVRSNPAGYPGVRDYGEVRPLLLEV
jgi:Icc-related predicted phosphoesterase